MKKFLLSLSFLLTALVAVQAQDSTLQQYVGTYKFPDGSAVPEVTVSIDNGVLMMNSSAGNSALERTGVDSFYITSFEGTAVFSRHTDKKVKGVYIEARGVTLDGVKEQPQGNIAMIVRRKEAILSL